MALTKGLGIHIHAQGCAHLHTKLEDKAYGPLVMSSEWQECTHIHMMHGIALLHLTVPKAVWCPYKRRECASSGTVSRGAGERNKELSELTVPPLLPPASTVSTPSIPPVTMCVITGAPRDADTHTHTLQAAVRQAVTQPNQLFTCLVSPFSGMVCR